MDRNDRAEAADASLSNDRLHALHWAQVPGRGPSEPPEWIRGPEDVAELVLWGLCSPDCTCRDEAVVLAAWFRDRPDVVNALGFLEIGRAHV